MERTDIVTKSCSQIRNLERGQISYRQLIKNELNLIPYFQHRKKWTGWDLNPRPQPTSQGRTLYPNLYDRAAERKLFKSHQLHAFSLHSYSPLYLVQGIEEY